MTARGRKQERPALAPGERVIVAWAEDANGPGWSNRPVFVLISGPGGANLRTVCLQPEEQCSALQMLHGVSAEMSRLTAALAVGAFNRATAADREG